MKTSKLHEKNIENAEEKLGAAKYLLEGGFYSDAASRAYYSIRDILEEGER